MAISRPFLLALLAAALLGATFFAVQSAREDSGDAAPAAQQAQQQAATPQAEPAASPADTLKAAFDVGAIDSAAFALDFSARTPAERATVELSGAYESGAANDVPELSLDAKLTAPGERLQGGFVSLGDKAYFTRGDTGWQVPDEVWSPLVQAVANGAPAQLEQRLAIDPQRWVRDVESRDGARLDGVETTHVSATIDPKLVARDLTRLARSNGAPVPNIDDAAGTIRRAEVEAWVGADDKLLRRLSAEVAFATPRRLRGPGDAARGTLELELELTGVNEPQEIQAPANVRRGMPGGAFGQLAEGFAAGLSGVGGGQPVSLAALTSRNPQKAARAVQAGRKVVILFQNPRGLDDRAMAKVMRAVDRRTQALVLTDHVDAVERYGKMVEDIGVSQTPSVVLIDRAGDARLIEGYVDTKTLAQALADAR